MADSRFARLHTDPRFRRPKKANQKVVVDERFKSIFEDTDPKNSKSKKSKAGRVDKYGRHLPDSHDKDNLKRFYKLEDSTTEDSKSKKSSSAEAKEPKFVDYARGEVLLESSDEEDSDIQQQRDDQESNIDNSDDDDEDDEKETGPIVLGRHISKPIPILANEDLSDSDSENLEVDLNEDTDNTDLYAELEAQAAAYTQTDDEVANANADDDGDDSDGENAVVKTSRLAVVNLDWDHVRASHLYKIFSSLVSPSAPALIPSTKTEEKPSKTKKGGKRRKNGKEEAPEPSGPKIVRGRILSVRIYPSQFGKERLKKEEVEGPPKEIFKRPQKREEAELMGSLIQEDDGEEYNEKALRKYQLERLRYYYAIVTCDTPSAASHILSELDGTELERSANVFDLSYVPSDMTFDDPPRDEATPSSESSSSLTTSLDPAGTSAGANYRPLDFSTDALRHSKVQLKWDEDDPERNKVTRRTLTKKEIDEGDFRGLIASSSGESGSESDGEDVNGKQQQKKKMTTAKESAKEKGKAERERLRKLLLGGGKDEMPEGWDRADPFGSGDFDGDSEDGGRVEGDMEITFLPGLSEANTNAEETTLDKYKRKQKEKRQARKKELKEKKDGGEGLKENEREKEGKKKKKGVDDDFFAQDSDDEDEEEEEEENRTSKKERSKSKNGKKERQDKNGSDSETEINSRRPATEAELELLVAPDDTQDSGGIHNHFDMKSIIKSEKAKGKSKKFKNKKRNKQGEEEELQEDFQIDVKDDRFKALHEDHTFAIDPSNPHFKKTKSMVALLDERSKRRQHTRDDNDRTDIRSAKGSKNQNQNEDTSSAPQQSLKSLVESVKRKSNHSDGKGVGKRQRL